MSGLKIMYYAESQGLLNSIYNKLKKYQLPVVLFQEKNELNVTLNNRQYKIVVPSIVEIEDINDYCSNRLTIITIEYNTLNKVNVDNEHLYGFSRLLVDALRSITNKAIYYFNIIDENNYARLNSRISNQLFNRLEMALFIENGGPIDNKDRVAVIIETDVEEFAVQILQLEKRNEGNPLNAWYNIGSVYGLDAWSMTSSNFIPFTKNEIEEELKRFSYFDVIKECLQIDQTIQFFITVLINIRNGDSQFFVSSEKAYYGVFVSNRFY